MASLALEAALNEDGDAAKPEGQRRPLTDWQRKQILIAAAATVALGAPVRILEIRQADEPATRWTRTGRAGKRPPKPMPFLRRAGAALAAQAGEEGEQ
jgi:hypothetical protein